MVEQRTFFPRLEALDLTAAKHLLPDAVEVAYSRAHPGQCCQRRRSWH